MRVLVLGGGGFLGYHAVDQARELGHDVTVFSRDKDAPMPGVEVIVGDRTDDVDGLRRRSWDLVIDTFTDDRADAPAIARTAGLLSGSVGCYCYVSGMSVYAPDGPNIPDEQAPVRRAQEEPGDDPLQARSLAKLAGEAAVRENFAGAGLFPRVGIMIGPRDPSSRFTWWPVRFHRAMSGAAATSVVAPGRAGRPVQFSDARDVARWMVKAGLRQLDGVFNVVGPGVDAPFAEVLDACLAAASDMLDEPVDVSLRWAPDENAIREALSGVDEEQRPLWYPENQIPQRAIDSSAARAEGLLFRPVRQTAAETLTWALQHQPHPLPDFCEPTV